MENAIDILADAGFDGIDFSAFAREEYYTDAHDASYYTELRAYAEDKGLAFLQAHAPFNSSFPDEEKTEKRFHEIVCSMKNAALLGVKNIVVHPCQHLTFWEEGMPERLFEINMAFYRRLLPYAEEYGIRVCTENMYQQEGVIVQHSTCSRPPEMNRYFDEIRHPLFGCCLDVGHTVLVREDPSAFVRAMGKTRLTCLHVHDVDGMHDNHTLPYFGAVYEWDSHMGEYTGGVNWVRFMKTLAEVGYTGDLTFEADNFMRRLPEENAADASRFMGEVGRYLLGIYEQAKEAFQ
jgi:sugar phosphate isomerase/epimerase